MAKQTKWYFLNPLRHIDMPRGARTANARNTTFTQKMISCFKTISGTRPHYDDKSYHAGEAGVFDWLTVGITYFLMYAETNLVGPKAKQEKLNRLLRGAIFLILTLPVLILKGVRLVFSGVGTLLALPVLALVHVLFSKIPKWWEERSQAKAEKLTNKNSSGSLTEEEFDEAEAEADEAESDAIDALKKAEQDSLNLSIWDLIDMIKSMSLNITIKKNEVSKVIIIQDMYLIGFFRGEELITPMKIVPPKTNRIIRARFFTQETIGAALAALNAALKDDEEELRSKFLGQKPI